MKIDLNYTHKKLSENDTYEVTLIIKCNVVCDGDTTFIAEVQQSGIFSISNPKFCNENFRMVQKEEFHNYLRYKKPLLSVPITTYKRQYSGTSLRRTCFIADTSL